jgi:hypothetical protein
VDLVVVELETEVVLVDLETLHQYRHHREIMPVLAVMVEVTMLLLVVAVVLEVVVPMRQDQLLVVLVEQDHQSQ